MEKVILVAIAKEEEQYLREWIDYHLNLGFDEIIIYDNNQIGDDGQKIIIESYSNKVIYKDYRGIYDNNQQNKAYTEAYIHNTFDWIMFLDIDEFLDLCMEKENISPIHEFLKSSLFEKFNAVRIPWVYYTDNDLLYNSLDPVLKRFTTVNKNIPDKLNYYKGIYRSIPVSKKWIRRIKSVHRFSITPVCDVTGKFVEYREKCISSSTQPHIKHFRFKTAEECHNKMCKGDAISGEGIRSYLVKWFFLVNKWTKEKEDILRYGKSIQ